MFTSQFMVHSEGYFPPEIMLGKYSDRSDVFSFGVVSLVQNAAWSHYFVFGTNTTLKNTIGSAVREEHYKGAVDCH